MAPRTNQLMTAELSLVNLKNCLANLPHSLVTPLLSNTTTVLLVLFVFLFYTPIEYI